MDSRAENTRVLADILCKEFGIKSDAELDEALKRMPGINLAPFVCVPPPPACLASDGMSVDSPADSTMDCHSDCPWKIRL